MPYLLILAGFFIYYAAYGWTLATSLSMSLFATAFCLLLALVLMIRK